MTHSTQQQGNAALIAVIVLALLAGGVWYVVEMSDIEMSAGDTMETTEEAVSSSMMEGEEGVMMEAEEGAMMENTDATNMMEEQTGEAALMEKEKTAGGMMEGEPSDTMVTGSYEAYAPEKLARADRGDVVLFFHASWCPTCRAADKNITESGVPAGITILKANYDTETALRKKYGITSQHTFVQVDSEGNLLKKWGGSSTVAQIQTEVI